MKDDLYPSRTDGAPRRQARKGPVLYGAAGAGPLAPCPEFIATRKRVRMLQPVGGWLANPVDLPRLIA